jgi:hypothetical protein
MDDLFSFEPDPVIDDARVIETTSWIDGKEPTGEHRYRYSVSLDDSEGSPPITVWCTSYPVIRRTPRGAWIAVDGTERFVLDGPGRQAVRPPDEEPGPHFILEAVAVASEPRETQSKSRTARRGVGKETD